MHPDHLLSEIPGIMSPVVLHQATHEHRAIAVFGSLNPPARAHRQGIEPRAVRPVPAQNRRRRRQGRR